MSKRNLPEFYFLHQPVYSSGIQIQIVRGKVLPDPVISLGERGEWDERRIQSSTVLYDKQKKKFRMWYSGLGDELAFEFKKGPGSIIDSFGRHRTVHTKKGYAEGNDGLHWTKPKLGLVEYRGSKENNILLFPPALVSQPFVYVIEDPGEKPHRHRFKAVIANYYGAAGFAFSNDGINWKPHKNGANIYNSGQQRGEKEGFDYYTIEPFSFLKDCLTKDPKKRYRIYAQASTGGPHWIRRTGLVYSPDARNWKVHPVPIMGLPDGATGYSGQVHSLSVMLYKGYYIAFIDLCLPHPKTGWLAPRTHLALSKDGENFQIFEDQDNPLMPLGPEGSWWEGGIAGEGILNIKDEFWCYFTGLPVTAAWTGGIKEADEKPIAQTGLAKWDYERILSVGLKPGFAKGYLILEPFSLKQGQIPEVIINGECKKVKEDIRVSLLDSKSRLTVSGFSFNDFSLKRMDDSRLKGKWKGKVRKDIMVLPCFQIVGDSTRLYSVEFPHKAM